MRRGSRANILVVVAVLAAACGGGANQDAAPDEVETLEPTPTDDEVGQPDGSETEVDPMTSDDPEAFALADAAQRAGVAPGEVTVVAHEDVTWPDGALGCPQPDQFYTQALVPGYRVIVEAGGERFHYHGQAGQPAAYCAAPSEPANEGGVVDR